VTEEKTGKVTKLQVRKKEASKKDRPPKILKANSANTVSFEFGF
jgi:hypothetical protein